MLIDCGTCAARPAACADCVVTALLDTPAEGRLTTDEVAAKYTRPGASTFGGNLVTSEAARATLEFLESNRLDEAAASRLALWICP